MKTIFAIILFSLGFSYAHSQAKLHGFVKDKLTGEPLIGANVFIKGTTIGVATNNMGYYTLQLLKNGDVNIVASYIGYKVSTLNLDGIESQMVNLYLEPGMELSEVKVKAPLFSAKQFGANLTEIPIVQIKQMPSLLGEVDLIRTYQLLPGVQGGSEGQTGMFVRGGGSGQNLIILDGSPLYYVNHLGGFSSIFDPESVKNFKLYKGGFPARFGGRLSSVLDVQMKEGDKHKKQTYISLGVISGKFSTQGSIQNGKGSYIVSLRRMWLDLLLRPFTYISSNGASLSYNFYDLNSKISLQITENDKLYFSLYSGDDRLSLNFKSEFLGPNIKASQKVRWGNLLGVARWNHTYKPGLTSDTRLSFTKYRFKDNDYFHNKKEEIEFNSYFKSRIYDFGLKSDFEYSINNTYKLLLGGSLILHTFDPGLNKAVNIENGQTFVDSIYGSTSINALDQFLYFENLININRANFNIGARISHFLVSGKNFVYFEPRFSAGIRLLTDVSLKSSYTQMHQFVNILSNTTSGFSTDFWVPATNKIPPGMSQQVSIGLEKNNQNYEAGIEIYYKKMNQLISFKEGEVFQGSAVDWQERIEKNGVGTSKGLELFVRKKTGRLTGWVSYTLAKSDRQFKNINLGEIYPFKYDRRHDLSIVLNIPVNDKWNFSTTWVYGSGYPITLALGKMNIISHGLAPDNSTDFYSFDEVGEYYGSKNSFRMKGYHRLDMGFTHTSQKGKFERVWTIGIYNVYNRQNPNYYFYKEKSPWKSDHTTKLYQSSLLPFIPAVSYSIRF